MRAKCGTLGRVRCLVDLLLKGRARYVFDNWDNVRCGRGLWFQRHIDGGSRLFLQTHTHIPLLAQTCIARDRGPMLAQALSACGTSWSMRRPASACPTPSRRASTCAARPRGRARTRRYQSEPDMRRNPAHAVPLRCMRELTAPATGTTTPSSRDAAQGRRPPRPP